MAVPNIKSSLYFTFFLDLLYRMKTINEPIIKGNITRKKPNRQSLDNMNLKNTAEYNKTQKKPITSFILGVCPSN